MRNMNMIFALVFVLTGAYCFAQNNDEKSKPNIIFILSDDQGYGDLGCYGSTVIETPNMDRLSEEGIRFNSFYVHNCCSPTRLAFMTGSHADRAGYSKVIYRHSKIGIISGRNLR